MAIALAAQASKGVASIDQTHLANPPPIGELFFYRRQAMGCLVVARSATQAKWQLRSPRRL